jgi:prolyl-tRNA editing enzyme YbaK/EbsC (Cys-tRNA(Pro) deacylase)
VHRPTNFFASLDTAEHFLNIAISSVHFIMPAAIFQRITALLAEHSIPYRHVHHQPTYTSEESARARGESTRIGGKALVMKIEDQFKLFVLSAARRMNSRAVKDHLGVKRTRFADKDELMELTSCVPGCVPPFGEPITALPLYLDSSILENEKIAFNAGSLTDSIIMKVEDYLTLIDPVEIFDFSKV